LKGEKVKGGFSEMEPTFGSNVGYDISGLSKPSMPMSKYSCDSR
jgi:hypothetical protein